MTSITLTNRTDSNYEIRDGTCFVAIGTQHPQDKEQQIRYFSSIYYFIVDGNIKLFHGQEDDFYYLLNFETHNWYPKKYVKGVIDFLIALI